MKYYKLINKYSVEEYTKPYVYVEGVQISNPSKEILAMANIKPLTVDDEPVYDAEKQWLIPYYEDGEQCITQRWKVEDIPPIEEVVTDEQAATT